MSGLRRTPYLIICLVTLVAGFTYILHSGYYFDDAYNSLIPAKIRHSHLSFWKESWLDVIRGAASGRIAPLCYPLINGFWVLFEPQALNRVAMLSINVIASVAVLACVHRTTQSLPLTGIVGVALLALLRTHNFHSAITSYNGVLQFVLISWCAAWWLTEAACEQQSLGRVLGAGACLLAACLQNESGLGALPALIAVVLLSSAPPRFKITATVIIAGLCGLFLVGYLLNRAFFVSRSYDGIALGSTQGILRTFGLQLLATLPGAEFLAAEHRRLLTGPSLVQALFSGSTFLVMVGSLWLCRESYRGRAGSDLHWRIAAKLFATGLCWMVVPALAISISDKYQRFLSLGVGYMHVYLQQAGCALVLGAGLVLVTRSRFVSFHSRSLCAAGSILLVGATVFSHAYCQIMIEAQNSHWKFPRQVLERALGSELLDPDQPLAAAVFLHTKPFHQTFFIEAWSQRKTDHAYWLDQPSHLEAIKMHIGGPNARWLSFLDYYSSPKGESAYAVAGKVIDVQLGPENFISYTQARLYREWQAAGVPAPTYAFVPCLRYSDGTPYMAALSLERLKTIRQTKNGITSELPNLDFVSGRIQFGEVPVQIRSYPKHVPTGLIDETMIGINMAAPDDRLRFRGEAGQYVRQRGTVPDHKLVLKFKVSALPRQNLFAKIFTLNFADGRQVVFQHDWGDTNHAASFRANYYNGADWTWVTSSLILDSGEPREVTLTLHDDEMTISWDAREQHHTKLGRNISGQDLDIFWGNDSYSQTSPFSGEVEFL